MRLIGAGEPGSLIAADISASLRGLGRGDETAGGIAMMQVKPPHCGEPFDAVVVMPHGVLLISGVELPGPTMRLDAPLHGQWKADNWPLVGSGDAMNPGTGALAASRHLAQRITHEAGLTLPVATVLAVGPFVDSVTPGEGDLDQPVRVLYPTINGLKTAIAELTPPGPHPCSAEQARAVLRAVDPASPIQPDTTLAMEGFPSAVTTARAGAESRESGGGQASAPKAGTPRSSTPDAPSGTPTSAASAATPNGATVAWQASSGAVRHGQPPAASVPAVPPSASAAAQQPAPSHPHPAQGPPHQRPSNGPRQRPMLLRPLPIAVVCLLVVGLIAVIAVATAGASDTSPTNTTAPLPDLVIHDVDGLDFHVMAANTDRRCARHTYGDLRTAVADSDCEGVHLGSYLTSVDDRRVAVSVAAFEFRSSKQAKRIDTLVTTKGTGWALDLATARDAWPDASGIGTASYRNATSGAKLRLVRAVWLDGSEHSDDTSLTPVIQRAFAVPTPNLR
ncbi:hypothetical protein [Haloechinothrix halophila]|uniref:hypothetical protein n=1 Tax=Haloechinothrix halophila TaxID=1069073 RepID=UPI0003FBB437|nr:hypothetical protein [Haloechinothrix halophila]